MDQLKIYYNLHKHCLSVLHKTKKGWRLKEYRKSIKLKNVRFVVSEAGRQRVLREFRKNVHAFVVGEEINKLPKNRKCDTIVRYNPYYSGYFNKTFGTGSYAIMKADCCIIKGKIIKVPYESIIG